MSYFKSLLNQRNLILQLIKKDFKDRYLGSYLGTIWIFIQPIITISIFWFIFQVGFKSVPVDGIPFILWLVSGMLPWLFFSETLSSTTNVIADNKFLVKNVVFDLKILHITKIVSSLIIHSFFVIILICMFLYYGFYPTVYFFQIFYYLFASIVLLYSISLITSALNIFLKDTSQIISLILQFGYWLTPIFWSLKMIPEKYHTIIKLNPMYYIIEGYRNSLMFRSWFWEYPKQTIFFWIFIIIVFTLGKFVFNNLKRHFIDVI